jgi:hypothetical protein
VLEGFFLCARNLKTKGGGPLKRGVIIYVAGEAPESWNDDHERGVKELLPRVDAIEIITNRTGHFDVMDAWWSLHSKGMTHIECWMAMFAEKVELRDTGRVLMLCG